MGRKLLVVAQKILPLTTDAVLGVVTNERIIRDLSHAQIGGHASEYETHCELLVAPAVAGTSLTHCRRGESNQSDLR